MSFTKRTNNKTGSSSKSAPYFPIPKDLTISANRSILIISETPRKLLCADARKESRI